MNPEQLAGIVRHLGTFFGGYLVAKLSLPPEYVESVIGGLASVAAIIWSIASKKPIQGSPNELGSADNNSPKASG